MKTGDIISCVGYLPYNVDGKDVFIRFTAFVSMSTSKNGKKYFGNFLSTLHFPISDYIETFETEEYMLKTGKIINRKIPVFMPHTVFSDYHKLAGYIDQCNDEVGQYFPLVRQTRWKVKLLWHYVFSIFHNTRMFRNMAGCDYDSKTWRQELCQEFSHLGQYDQEHEYQQFTTQVNKRANCFFCSKKTYHKCTACTIGICENCFSHTDHLNHINSDQFKQKRKIN